MRESSASDSFVLQNLWLNLGDHWLKLVVDLILRSLHVYAVNMVSPSNVVPRYYSLEKHGAVVVCQLDTTKSSIILIAPIVWIAIASHTIPLYTPFKNGWFSIIMQHREHYQDGRLHLRWDLHAKDQLRC
jgi:hypothetical protein